MQVGPFKAFRFDAGVVGDVGSCIAPPYDVINISQQEQLYKKNRHNLVRIIKGQIKASDDDENNQYTRAADYLAGWIEEGALKQDSDDTIYAYTQEFEVAGVRYHRSSFIALAKLTNRFFTSRWLTGLISSGQHPPTSVWFSCSMMTRKSSQTEL